MLGLPLPILTSLGWEPVISITVEPSTTCKQQNSIQVEAAIAQKARCTANGIRAPAGEWPGAIVVAWSRRVCNTVPSPFGRCQL